MSEQLSRSTRRPTLEASSAAQVVRRHTAHFEEHAPALTFGLETVQLVNNVADLTLGAATLQQQLQEHSVLRSPQTRLLSVLEESLEGTTAWHAQELEAVYDSLSDVRLDLYDLSSAQRRLVDTYLDNNAPRFLKHAKEQAPETSKSWTKWLVTHAKDETLTNILQWHAYTLGEQAADGRTHEFIDWKRQVFKQATTFLVETEVLAPEAWVNCEGVDAIDVVVGDIFDMSLEGRVGYHVPQTQQVAVEQGVGLSRTERHNSLVEKFDYTLFHEWLHAVVAAAYGRHHLVMSARWLNEALTERIAIMMKLYEKHEMPQMQSYRAEQELLRVVLRTDTEFAVAEALATRAYSGDENDYLLFADAIDAAWGGRHVLQQINEYIALNEKEDDAQDRARAIDMVRRTLLVEPGEIFELMDA